MQAVSSLLCLSFDHSFFLSLSPSLCNRLYERLSIGKVAAMAAPGPSSPVVFGWGRDLYSRPSSTFLLPRLPRLIHFEVIKMGAETMV